MVAPYKMSFTAVSLALRESVKIAQVYTELGDWDATRQRVLDANLLQARSPSSAKRTYQEIAPRLQALSDPQLDLLLRGDLQEQRALLWVAICKRYALVREFAIEVLRVKFETMDYALTEADYDTFFARKAIAHEGLADLSATTQRKVQTVLLRMLREAGLITQAHEIVPAVLSPRLSEVLAPDAPDAWLIFAMPLP